MKARKFQKNTYFCFIDYPKAFDCVDHNRLWKILKEIEIPDHITYVLRNLYTGQGAPGNTWYNCRTSTGSPLVTAKKSQCVVRASQKWLYVLDTNQKILPVVGERGEG